MKHSENGSRGVASLELGGKWMCEKVLLCLSFVLFQGIVEDELEVGRRGHGGHGVSMRCDGGSEEIFRIEDDSGIVGDGEREKSLTERKRPAKATTYRQGHYSHGTPKS